MPMGGTNVLAAGFSETLLPICYVMTQSIIIATIMRASNRMYVCISHLAGINIFF